MAHLTLEVVEGPDAGTTASLAGTMEIGRDPAAGLALSDAQASRRHARISAAGGEAVIEDLGSSNGTFVNDSELHVPARIEAGDELLIGVSVIEVRSAAQMAERASGVRRIPPALAVAQRRPTFVDPVQGDAPRPVAAVPALDRLVDARTKAQAMLAPYALFVLVALVVAIYFGTRSA